MTTKRERLNEIRRMISRTALELFATSSDDKLTYREAERLATQQVAKAERMKPPRNPTKHNDDNNNNTSSSNVREELFQRILSIKSRLPDPNTPTPKETAPTAVLGKIARYIFRGDDDEPAAKPVETKPKPVPSSTYSEVYIGKGNREMINSEFDNHPRYHDDETTSNWRRSIESSKPRKPEGEIPADVVTNPARLEEYQNIIAFPRVSK